MAWINCIAYRTYLVNRSRIVDATTARNAASIKQNLAIWTNAFFRVRPLTATGCRRVVARWLTGACVIDWYHSVWTLHFCDEKTHRRKLNVFIEVVRSGVTLQPFEIINAIIRSTANSDDGRPNCRPLLPPFVLHCKGKGLSPITMSLAVLYLLEQKTWRTTTPNVECELLTETTTTL